MQKRKQHSNVRILPCGGNNIEIAVLNEGKRALIRLDERVHVVVIIQISYKA
jgi:hypothetical protein